MKNLSAFSKRFVRVPADATVFSIALYQRIVSPDHGVFDIVAGTSRCRFYPSCSAYAISAIRQYGLLKGSVVSFKRILRCNPWSPGGYDPVEARSKN